MRKVISRWKCEFAVALHYYIITCIPLWLVLWPLHQDSCVSSAIDSLKKLSHSLSLVILLLIFSISCELLHLLV